MSTEKGLNKPVELKSDLAKMLGATELPRTEITKKLWDYIKNKTSGCYASRGGE